MSAVFSEIVFSEMQFSEILTTIQILELAVTWALIGLIWLIQIVGYPLFAAVGADHFTKYEQQHCNRITFIVAPLMLTEGALAVAHLWASEGSSTSILGLSLLACVWLSTFFVQVPLHNRLTRGFNLSTQSRLVRTNWIRTIAWSARGLLLLVTCLSAAR